MIHRWRVRDPLGFVHVIEHEAGTWYGYENLAHVVPHATPDRAATRQTLMSAVVNALAHMSASCETGFGAYEVQPLTG